MASIFFAIGGSGSRHLIDRLEEKYTVGDKPDTLFHYVVGNQDVDQGSFYERTGAIRRGNNEGMESLFCRYLKYVDQNDDHVAVFNTVAVKGLFSKYGIEDVVFLVRHPLHAYVSWCKPHRHGDLVDQYGGVNSKTGVEWFSKRWKLMVMEIKTLSELSYKPHIVRFEHASGDTSGIPNIEWVFDNINSDKRNYGVLSPMLERYMLSLVSDEYFYLYNEWNI